METRRIEFGQRKRSCGTSENDHTWSLQTFTKDVTMNGRVVTIRYRTCSKCPYWYVEDAGISRIN